MASILLPYHNNGLHDVFAFAGLGFVYDGHPDIYTYKYVLILSPITFFPLF